MYLRRLLEAGRAHHGAVHPRDGEDGGGPPRGARHGAEGLGAARLDDRVVGQEGLEVLGASDGADARAAAAVRDAEGLVQVKVAHIGAEVARAAETDLERERGRFSTLDNLSIYISISIYLYLYLYMYTAEGGAG